MNHNILTILIVVIAVSPITLKENVQFVRRPVFNPLVVEFNEVHDFQNCAMDILKDQQNMSWNQPTIFFQKF